MAAIYAGSFPILLNPEMLPFTSGSATVTGEGTKHEMARVLRATVVTVTKVFF